MDVKEAAHTAKSYLIDVFSDEGITDVGLEEVELNAPSNTWKITLGFSRPWNRNRNPLIGALPDAYAGRSYKVVSISNSSGRVISIKDRILDASK